MLGTLKVEDVETLQNLEIELSFNDLLLYRKIVRKNAQKTEVTARKESTGSGGGGGGWFSSWFSSSKDNSSASSTNSIEPNNNLQQTFEAALEEEDLKTLHETIDFQSSQTAAVVEKMIDPLSTQHEFSFLLEKGALSIYNVENSRKYDLQFVEVEVGLVSRATSFKSTLSLKDIILHEGFIEGSFFPVLISADSGIDKKAEKLRSCWLHHSTLWREMNRRLSKPKFL